MLPKIARHEPQENIIEIEYEMLYEFKRQAIPHLQIMPENDWEWLAVAQHHRMATRLLDWTWNSLAALWFTVERPADEGIDGAVWTFCVEAEEYIDDEKQEPLEQRMTRVYEPKSIASRISSQQACFTVHEYSRGEKAFVALEKNQRYKGRLRKLLIDRRSFRKIRSNLDRCGMNNALLFPEIEGLCRHINWTHLPLSDERER